ncbi:MAG: TlyA family RNA methyltransferase [Oscillospiraceae bacterium]|nr:TlyA family RNA methyltransferase [Oscillospiraceae bacterium]
MSKIRLDQLLFEKGFAPSREKARALIMSGCVFLEGQRADKPGQQVSPDAEPDVRMKELPFVSRGGYKLDKALRVFPIDPTGKICIDCGASTGGFTDVLLQHGAQKVYAVDVGYGQLAWKIRNDERVVSLERTNLRYVTEEQIPEKLDLAVCDVSFISLKLVMPAVAGLLKPGAEIMCLIKPQFEAGRELVGKKGVVRDPKVHEQVIQEILSFMPSIGFSVCGLDYSPITGPEGNVEFLLYMKNELLPPVSIDVAETVEKAHTELKK